MNQRLSQQMNGALSCFLVRHRQEIDPIHLNKIYFAIIDRLTYNSCYVHQSIGTNFNVRNAGSVMQPRADTNHRPRASFNS